METYNLTHLKTREECYGILSQLFGQPETEFPHIIRILDTLLRNAAGLTPKELQLVRKLRKTLRNSDIQEIASEYTNLFQGEKALAVPYGSYYLERNGGNPGFVELFREYYIKASFINTLAVYSDDHIVIELSFLNFLIQQSIQALKAGYPDRSTFYSCLHCQFIKEHMMLWIPDFTRQILINGRSPFYLQLAILTRTILVNCLEQEDDSM